MKIKQLESIGRNTRVDGSCPPARPGLSYGQSPLPQTRTERSRIQWPTGQQMQDVAKHLARISREGRRCELAGDYFRSGDLAYQLQEIIRATDELLKKCRRTKT